MQPVTDVYAMLHKYHVLAGISPAFVLLSCLCPDRTSAQQQEPGGFILTAAVVILLVE